jgi:hypothetical protein
MFRQGLIQVGIFLIPFAVYALFLWGTKKRVWTPDTWPLARVMTLTIAGLVLTIASFVALAHFSGSKPGTTYVPAHMENGQFVPGGFR